jgi:sterol 3beta-glucosyltransferase
VRIDILAIGSLGDVLPSVALGLGLSRAGYRVRLVTLDGFQSLIEPHGLAHLSIGRGPNSVASSPAGRAWAEQRDSAIGFLRGFIRIANDLIEQGLADYWNSGDRPEALIVTAMGLPVGGSLAERLGVPLIRVSFAPSRPDWDCRRDLATRLRVSMTAAVANVFRQLLWLGLRPVTNRARRTILGLPGLPARDPVRELDARRVPLLEAYSPSVVPSPPGVDDWMHVTGYWFLEEDPTWQPPQELLEFLSAGPPPVFIGFGSTPFPSPARATAVVVDAVRGGQRAIVLAGGSGLETGRLSEVVLSVPAAPHGWLFERVSAAVHHGGAGVTGAVLRAGLPSVVVPIFGDQPFWGQRIFDSGVAARPIPAKRLTAEALADAIRQTKDPEMRHRAKELGQRIRREDGVARAVDVITRHLGQRAPRTAAVPAVGTMST